MEEQRQLLTELLQHFSNIVIGTEKDWAPTDLAKHRIKAGPCTLFKWHAHKLGAGIPGYQVREPPTGKVDTVRQRPTPWSVSESQSFLGLTLYYWHFLHAFADITVPPSNGAQKLRAHLPVARLCNVPVHSSWTQTPAIRAITLSSRRYTMGMRESSHTTSGAFIFLKHFKTTT